MDKNQLIYKVLNLVNENKEDVSIPKGEIISILKFLESENLIRLKSTKIYINQDKDDIYSIENSDITMGGLNYLNDNSEMAKVVNVSNFDYVLLSIWEEYTSNNDTDYENINQTKLGLEVEEYIKILKRLENENYINGIEFSGRGNYCVPWLEKIVITEKGLKYINRIGNEEDNKLTNDEIDRKRPIRNFIKDLLNQLRSDTIKWLAGIIGTIIFLLVGSKIIDWVKEFIK